MQNAHRKLAKAYAWSLALPKDEHGNTHQGNGGRHVMQVGDRLIDGQRDGYTGAQYANSAYRVPVKWSNKAELKAGGTIRVMASKTIYPGEEILFAYHTEYWRRWGMTSKRGRKPSNSTAQEQPHNKRARATMAPIESPAPQIPARTDAASQDQIISTGQDSNTTNTVPPDIAVHVHKERQTEAIGVRVVGSTASNTSRARGRGRGRGRGQGSRNNPKVTEPTKRVRKRTMRQYQWSTVGRDAFNVAQTIQPNNKHDQSSNGNHGTRFERGEGGGVT